MQNYTFSNPTNSTCMRDNTATLVILLHPKKQGFYCRFNSMDCIKKTLNKRERQPLID